MYKKIFRSMCFLSFVTLLISTIFIITACYTSISNSFISELESEASEIVAVIGSSDRENMLSKVYKNITDKRITIVDNSGMVVFDNRQQTYILNNHIDRQEIREAFEKGTSSSVRNSETLSARQFYYAVKMPNGYVLRLGDDFDGVYSMFYSVFVAILFVIIMLYLLILVVAKRLTENILKPIKNATSDVNSADSEMYEEIKPFILRISNQNKEISRQMENIKLHKMRLQTIADNMNEGLIVIDNDGIILSANDYALNIFSIDEFNAKYRHYDVLCNFTQIYQVIGKALNGEKGNILFSLGDKAYQVFYSAVHKNNLLTGAILLLFDISDMMQAEEMRREFTANVSHELKTPLTSIHGYAQVINSGIAKPEDISGFVKKIEKESSRLIILIDDIIRLSKLDEDEAVEKQPNNILSVAKEVTEQLKAKAEQRNISVDVSGDDSEIIINTAQLTQIIYNLCDNAIKYNVEGGSVKIAVNDKTLTVSDTGIGIPDEYTDRIFERFFRVDKSHSKMVDGTGLGLSIVKHIIISNGAAIDVKSKVGKGTEFIVKFG